MTQYDGLIPVGAGGNHADGHVHEGGQTLEVFAGVDRQRVVISDTHCRLLPARHFLVYRLDAGIAVDTQWRLGHDFALDAVTDRHPDRVEAIQHIELGDAQARNTRMHDCAPQSNRVEPAAPAAAARHRAELMPHPRQVLAVFIEQLGRKWTRAYTRRVRLYDTNDFVKGTRPEAG